ncbi:MAG: dipeptide/tripeptide permease [Isosphaeraceae bacterium]|jgi:POT family proton-dependent oligopeptide transporter|nr:MAG: dipeptide/tripeptide permease [Isosphaeraceae bacterium]
MTQIAEARQGTDAPKPRHPRELYILFATEMWERFGFYTAAALMTLYLQYGGFNWTARQAAGLWANYLMFVYATPLIGGWLADRFLGYRRSVLLGGLFFIAGYALLSLGKVSTFYLALGLLFVGNGFFKPNISTMVGNLYPAGSPLKDSAYNIFYMGINIGAFLAPVVAEALRQRMVPDEVWAAAQQGLAVTAAQQEQLRQSFTSGFWAATIGMTIGTLILSVYYRRLAAVDLRRREDDINRTALAEDVPPSQETTEIDRVPERVRIAALIVVFAIVIVFWMVFHQNGSTMTIWADKNSDWKGSPSAQFFFRVLSLGILDPARASGVLSNCINPFWIVVLSIPLVRFWGWLRSMGREPSTPMKMAIGMALTSLAFLILFVAAKYAGGDQTFQYDEAGALRLTAKGEPDVIEGLVSPWWLITAYAVISLGELMLSPMGLSLVSKVAPARMRGLMMGGWFVATAIGNKLTAIGEFWAEWYHSQFWLLCAGAAAAMAVLLLLLLKPLKRAMPGV